MLKGDAKDGNGAGPAEYPRQAGRVSSCDLYRSWEFNGRPSGLWELGNGECVGLGIPGREGGEGGLAAGV